jgi:BMFP domain-containing protein YqiC
MRSGFQQNDERFDEINRRFDKIESLMLVEHRTRIERLEKKVERLEGLLAVK